MGQPAVRAEVLTAYIGTYTGEKSQGIYAASFDTKTGSLGEPSLAAKTESPSFLALHPTKPVLYAVGESTSIGPRREGAVSAFRIEKGSTNLHLINQQPSGGSGPCHLTADATGKCLLVANYGSGSVASLPIGEDGALLPPASLIQHHGSSINPRRQSGPHAHHVAMDPENKVGLVCDLGLDKVMLYRLTPEWKLEPNEQASASLDPGAGPRHLVFHPSGRVVYVINELSSSVSAFTYSPKTGEMRLQATVPTLPRSYTGENSCAEIQIHPSGKFLYASNRGHNSIAIFSVEDNSGALRTIEHQTTLGKTPRHFTLDPTGNWVLVQHQDSDSVVCFKLHLDTGLLTPTNQKIEVGKPVCLVFGKSK